MVPTYDRWGRQIEIDRDLERDFPGRGKGPKHGGDHREHGPGHGGKGEGHPGNGGGKDKSKGKGKD